MKWRASTLRKAAELQDQIERLERVLAELLKGAVLTGTHSSPVKRRASKASSQDGSLCSAVVSARKTKSVFADGLEILDEVLLWGNEFSSPESKNFRFVNTYRWRGLKPFDRDRFISAECDLTEAVSK
jgi:hypothetical protein